MCKIPLANHYIELHHLLSDSSTGFVRCTNNTVQDLDYNSVVCGKSSKLV